MQLLWGNYAHALNEAAIAVTKDPLLNEAGLMYGARERWQISGFLQAADVPSLVAACNALEAAYSRNYQNLTLIGPGGVRARGLSGRTALGGTRVVGGVTFPDDGSKSAEFSTYRNYQVTVEGVYPIPGVPATTLISWLETLSFTGGGPRFLHLQPLVGLPQRQQVAAATPFHVTQQGEAVGLYGYPVPAAPLWPADEHIDRRRVEYKTPKRTGDRVASAYTEWPVSWAYEFEANAPLEGAPTLWRG